MLGSPCGQGWPADVPGGARLRRWGRDAVRGGRLTSPVARGCRGGVAMRSGVAGWRPGGAGVVASPRTEGAGRMASGRDRSIGAAPTQARCRHRTSVADATNRQPTGVEQRGNEDRPAESGEPNRPRHRGATRPCHSVRDHTCHHVPYDPRRSPGWRRSASSTTACTEPPTSSHAPSRRVWRRPVGRYTCAVFPTPCSPTRSRPPTASAKSIEAQDDIPLASGRRAVRLRWHRLRLPDPVRQRSLAAAGVPRHHRVSLAERCAGRKGSRVLHRRGHDAWRSRVDDPVDVDLRLPPGNEHRPRRLRHRSRGGCRPAAAAALMAPHSSVTATD
jgi:hypothetical protein